jgi:hypothetical protein
MPTVAAVPIRCLSHGFILPFFPLGAVLHLPTVKQHVHHTVCRRCVSSPRTLFVGTPVDKGKREGRGRYAPSRLARCSRRRMPTSSGIMFLMYKLVVLVYIRQPCGIGTGQSTMTLSSRVWPGRAYSASKRSRSFFSTALLKASAC